MTGLPGTVSELHYLVYATIKFRGKQGNDLIEATPACMPLI